MSARCTANGFPLVWSIARAKNPSNYGYRSASISGYMESSQGIPDASGCDLEDGATTEELDITAVKIIEDLKRALNGMPLLYFSLAPMESE